MSGYIPSFITTFLGDILELSRGGRTRRKHNAAPFAAGYAKTRTFHKTSSAPMKISKTKEVVTATL